MNKGVIVGSMVLFKRNKIALNNFLIALILGSKIISDTVGLGLIILIGAIILLVINNFEKKVKTRYILCDIFLILIGLYFFIDYQIYGGNIYKNNYLSTFIIYICISVVYVRSEIQVDKMANILILIYILCSPLFLTKNFERTDSGTLMNFSYDILPLIITIILKILFLKVQKKKEWFLIVLTLPYLYFIFTYSSRNIYIASIFCLVICLIMKKKIIAKILILLVISMVLIVVFKNALDILYTIQGELMKYDLSFKIIDKNITLIEEDNITNGRDATYKKAINEIKEEPITGRGIGSFNEKYGTYPHNFILQMLYEGGIILLIIFSVPILYGGYAMILKKNISKQDQFMLVFLFCNAIIRLLISYEYWREMYFWMYIALSLCILATNRKKEGV